ncbi:MAG: ABC transporter ATP-binding protein [Firmicutes bacterium]|nr:ABC transporter ATP-binding protein [Bacillota bacterium]
MNKKNPFLPCLSAKQLDFYYGSHQVLKNINLTVQAGEFFSLIGPNGSGKSTLFKILGGLANPRRGEVLYEGQTLQKINARNRARCIAVVHQKSAQAMPFTCLESILLGLHPHRGRFEAISPAQYQQVQQLMKLTDTLKLAGKLITQISGGEQQRVALCRALVQKPKVLLLDEAMSELDVAARMQMSGLLKKLCTGKKLTVLAIYHDLNLAYRFSDKIYVLKEGACASFGPPAEVMTKDLFRRVFRVQAEVFANKGFFIKNTI